MEIPYSVKVLISASEIEARIEKEVIEYLKKHMGVDALLLKSNLKMGVQQILRRYIEKNPIFQSVIKGELLGELGLPLDRREWAANNMIDIIGAGIDIIIGADDTGITIHVVWTNDKIQELIYHGEASYVSSSGKPGVGGGAAKYQIPWLEWLLDGGSEVLITGYHIEYGDFPNSRSKKALMKEGGDWSMPSGDFSLEKNFISDSIEEATPEIIQFVASNL